MSGLYMTDPLKGIRNKLIDAITDLSLTTNLQLCLDAGDGDSYTSGNKWLDVSGNGHDFFLGSDGATASEKPTFNGTVNGVSANEYWSFDGGDFFRLENANPAWVDNLHQDTAVLSVLAIIGNSIHGGGGAICGTSGFSNANNGMIFLKSGSGTTIFQNTVGGLGGTVQSQNAIGKMTDDDVLNSIAFALDDDAGGTASRFVFNGVEDSTFDGSFGTPNAGAATYKMEIAAGGNAQKILESTDKLAALAIWENAGGSGAALTTANFADLHSKMLSRLQ